jgi:hypothetical protein
MHFDRRAVREATISTSEPVVVARPVRVTHQRAFQHGFDVASVRAAHLIDSHGPAVGRNVRQAHQIEPGLGLGHRYAP